MYLNIKYRSMYTLDILNKTLSFTLTSSSQVTLRLGVDVFYTGAGTSFNIPLPLKLGQVQEGAYVLSINGTETILSYKFPTEIPDIVWDVNGLLSTLSVSDNKTYTGTIISQSIECMPPSPLVSKTGLNKVAYVPNIYSGDWSIIRKIKLSYDAGNGLGIITTIENTYTKIVLNINSKNLYQAVTNYIKEFVENCSPQREIAKFTKVNAYLQQYENYVELVDYENAYNSLVKAGELVGVDKTIQEIIPFTISKNGGGCCDKEVVPAHTAYFGFSEVALMTDVIAKTLSIDKYNIYAHRDWHMSQDGITSRYAYIIVPTSVAALIAMVKLKGGLLAVWESQLITIDGIPYTAIKSPNKFFDKDATFVTDTLDDCDIAQQWVNSNGSKVVAHISDESLHLKQGDRPKLDNLDQTLSGFEPKRGADDFYVTASERYDGGLATGNATLTTVKEVADYTAGLTYKLIGSFTPIVGTGSFSTTYDGVGGLLSLLNIKRCIIEIYAASTATSIQIGLLRINNVSTNTYKQTTNIHTGILFRNNAETYSIISLDFSGILKFYAPSVNSNTMSNDATFSGVTYQGINRTILDSKLAQIELILGGGATFGINSIINIYVL